MDNKSEQWQRRILEWFRELGPKGVQSSRSDLSAAASRLEVELGMASEHAYNLLTLLQKRGRIETVNLNPRFTGVYNTHLSDAGHRFLERELTAITVNIHGGAVGAIQTGPSATANVAMQINPSVAEFISALDKLGEAIASERAAGSDDALALVDRTKAEASSPNPNASVIKTLLFAIPTTIQVTAALQPAYDIVKAAAQCFGIQLP